MKNFRYMINTECDFDSNENVFRFAYKNLFDCELKDLSRFQALALIEQPQQALPIMTLTSDEVHELLANNAIRIRPNYECTLRLYNWFASRENRMDFLEHYRFHTEIVPLVVGVVNGIMRVKHDDLKALLISHAMHYAKHGCSYPDHLLGPKLEVEVGSRSVTLTE